MFVLVLWLGREGYLLKQLALGRITHRLHWTAPVCASFVVLLVTSSAAIPIETTAYLAVVGTSSMLYGFYDYFRMEGIIATPDGGTGYRLSRDPSGARGTARDARQAPDRDSPPHEPRRAQKRDLPRGDTRCGHGVLSP